MPDVADLLAELVAEMRRTTAAVEGLRADVGRQRATDAGVLVRDAIRDYLGSEEFSAGMLLIQVERDPHGDLSVAISNAIDMNGPERSRRTALGILLANTPGIHRARTRRGIARYRLKVL